MTINQMVILIHVFEIRPKASRKQLPIGRKDSSIENQSNIDDD